MTCTICKEEKPDAKVSMDPITDDLVEICDACYLVRSNKSAMFPFDGKRYTPRETEAYYRRLYGDAA